MDIKVIYDLLKLTEKKIKYRTILYVFWFKYKN